MLATAAVLKDKEFALTTVPLDVPDIVWTLPEKAVQTVAPKFPGWEQATSDLRQYKGPINPKDLLHDRYDMKVTLSSLSRMIAVARRQGLEPSPALKAAMAAILGSAERPPQDVP